MKSIAVISNPLSRRNRRSLADVHQALSGHDNVQHIVLKDFSELAGVLGEIAKRKVQIVVLNGGDGTVHAALTHLFMHEPGYRPMFCVLAGGTSNTIALDVGIRGDRADALKKLIAMASTTIDESSLLERAVLRVDFGGAAPTYGMLFGAAGITRGIKIHRKLFPWTWFPDSLATVLMLFTLAGSWLIRGSVAKQVLEGESVRLEIDGKQMPQSHYAVLLASTLEKIVLGASPFWGDGEGAVRLSAVVYPPKRLIRSLRGFLFGPERDELPDSYQSWRAGQIDLHLRGAFVLDGEFYDIAPGAMVRLSADERVRFIRP